MTNPKIVFAFHNVSNSFNLGLNNLTIKKYTKILKFISASYPHASICFDDAYEDIFRYLYKLSEEPMVDKIIFPITNYIGRNNTWDINFYINRKKHINKEQLLLLYKSGWEIGSHGHNHISYAKLSNKEIVEDLIKSKCILEDLIGEEVNTFTPPFGYIDKKHIELIHKAGYNKLLLNDCYIKNMDDFYGLDVIKRINVYSIDSLSSLKNRADNNFLQKKIETAIHSCSKATVFFKHL